MKLRKAAIITLFAVVSASGLLSACQNLRGDEGSILHRDQAGYGGGGGSGGLGGGGAGGAGGGGH